MPERLRNFRPRRACAPRIECQCLQSVRPRNLSPGRRRPKSATRERTRDDRRATTGNFAEPCRRCGGPRDGVPADHGLYAGPGDRTADRAHAALAAVYGAYTGGFTTLGLADAAAQLSSLA